MVGVALSILVLGGTILQDAFYIAFRRSKIAGAARIVHSFLGRLCARILLVICLPGAMFCAAALYMRSWDESALEPTCLFLFVVGSVIGALIGLRQGDEAPSAAYKQYDQTL